MPFVEFMKRHPLVSYFGLAFSMAWIGVIAVAAPKFTRGEPLGLVTEGVPMLLAMLAGPSIAGIMMAAVVQGNRGIRDLFSGMALWRVSLRWYLALLIFPACILLVLLVLRAAVSPNYAMAFVPLAFLPGMLVGFLEELGWMGFAFPRMLARWSPLAAAILLGVIHTLWHLAADYLAASRSLGIHWLPHFAMFVAAMIAMRVILVWVYMNTGSLLLAQLMHSSSTASLAVLVSLPPAEDTMFYAVYSVVLWIAVAVVVARHGKRLTSEP